MNAPPEIQKRRVVIVEDHPMFREQLRLLINKEDDLVVCGEADNAAARALTIISKEKPASCDRGHHPQRVRAAWTS